MTVRFFLLLFTALIIVSCEDEEDDSLDMDLLTSETWNYGLPNDFSVTQRSIKFNSDGTYVYVQDLLNNRVEKINSWRYVESEKRIDMDELGVCFFDPRTEDSCTPPDIDYIIVSLTSTELRVRVVHEILSPDGDFEQVLTR